MVRTLVKNASNPNPRNLVINGGMDFWQRTSALAVATTTEGYKSVDRYVFRGSGGSATFNIERSTDVPMSVFKYSVAMTDTDAIADSITISQRIEAAMVRNLIGKLVTFSCWVKNESTAVTATLRLYTPVSGVEDDWSIDVFTVDTAIGTSDANVLSSGVWTRISYSVVLPASAVNGVTLYLFSNSVTGTPVLKTTGWMLTEGPSAPTDFYRAGDSIQAELAMCQRYFYDPFFNATVIETYVGTGQCFSATNSRINFAFPTTMRTVPSFGVSSASHYSIRAANGSLITGSTLGLESAGTSSGTINVNVAAGLVAGNATVAHRNTTSAALQFSAEL